MPQFTVILHRTLYKSLEFELDTKEMADALAKQIAAEYEDLSIWNNNDLIEFKYEVIYGDGN